MVVCGRVLSMNNKTNSWAAIVGTTALSEAVQRVAFTFGYQWKGVGMNITGTSYPVLIFNPDDKTIGYSLDQRTIGNLVCKACVTFDQVMDLFKNPPKSKKMEKVGSLEVYDDGSVFVESGVAITSDVFNKVVEIRNKLMGKKVKLPVIRFRYHSPTSGAKVRNIALLSEDKDHLAGLDLDDGNTFKQFRKDRLMVGGAIWFLGLTEE